MMIFNSFTVACNETILARNDRTAAVVAFSCRQIKPFEGICLAFAGKFPQKEL